MQVVGLSAMKRSSWRRRLIQPLTSSRLADGHAASRQPASTSGSFMSSLSLARITAGIRDSDCMQGTGQPLVRGLLNLVIDI